MKIYPVFLLFMLIACHPKNPYVLSPSSTMKIFISGAVSEEQWVEVPNFSTYEEIKHLIKFNENADHDAIHPSQIFRHNDKIVIPHIKEHPCISINTATLEELVSLNGVGEVTAKRILDYRTTFGYFRKLEDLMQIKGIKEKTFDKFKHQLCL
ncbi:MAG: helix-hairpin-helix domain-containing protein [Erysipelothrix sp.]|nr:helix-hairpin-helix domain-containing protein [Erysipelothrix sp.]